MKKKWNVKSESRYKKWKLKQASNRKQNKKKAKQSIWDVDVWNDMKRKEKEEKEVREEVRLYRRKKKWLRCWAKSEWLRR